jgi:hypothetical protein
MPADIHVVPVGDLQPHVETRACWCHPRVEQDPDARVAIVIHASADGRELIEQYGVQ